MKVKRKRRRSCWWSRDVSKAERPKDAGALRGDVKWTTLKIGVGSGAVAPFVSRQLASGPR